MRHGAAAARSRREHSGPSIPPSGAHPEMLRFCEDGAVTVATPSFEDLRERKRRVASITASQLRALQRFHYGDDLAGLDQGGVAVSGFALNPTEDVPDDPRLSLTSTATCVRSMLASPVVADQAAYTAILDHLQSRFEAEDLKTGSLEHGNPYTLGQLLPTLRRITPDGATPDLIPFAIERLRSATAATGVRIAPFPANAYLTYWSLVALDSWGGLNHGQAASLDWAESQLYRQLALFASADDEADAYQLGYCLLIQRRFRRDALKDSVNAAALASLFGALLPGGLWEKKERLFSYGSHGDAYPFTFELLNAILREFADAPEFLVAHETALERAAGWARRNAYGGDVPLWRSGHLADNAEPESWATAEIYYFFLNYHAYLADRILSGVMRETGRGRFARPPDNGSFQRLYQPAVVLPEDPDEPLLGDLLVERMLDPLRSPTSGRSQFSLARHPRRRSAPRSGIFFGPPGTGKTTYASAIASYLGWPLLTITPADFAAEGMLLIPTVGRRLFDRLLELEDTVVFFDEMEELMRTRAGEAGTFEQRFLTTSFLPALQDLRDQASCIYLVATNNFDELDEAARAPRRFDFQLQVRPPSFSEKLRMLERDFSAEAGAAVLDELTRAREKVAWATLREARAKFRELVGDPTEARDLLEQWTPTLFARKDELETEAENNSFEVA